MVMSWFMNDGSSIQLGQILNLERWLLTMSHCSHFLEHAHSVTQLMVCHAYSHMTTRIYLLRLQKTSEATPKIANNGKIHLYTTSNVFC
jgi:hypothetical protein